MNKTAETTPTTTPGNPVVSTRLEPAEHKWVMDLAKSEDRKPAQILRRIVKTAREAAGE